MDAPEEVSVQAHGAVGSVAPGGEVAAATPEVRPAGLSSLFLFLFTVESLLYLFCFGLYTSIDFGGGGYNGDRGYGDRSYGDRSFGGGERSFGGGGGGYRSGGYSSGGYRENR